MDGVYLDHAASTPARPEVVEAMLPWLSEHPGNPSGSHAVARAARRAIDDARDLVAALVGAQPGEVVFTSGGTEADNLAVDGVVRSTGCLPACSAVEHPAVLAPVAERTADDGRVSIEVEPDLAHDTDATIASAKALWAAVDRPNALIKIPATAAGLPAITAVIAEGISVNVTLIFSVERYQAVMDAYLEGLEKAKAAGHDLSTIRSVASFFVSRVDSEVDSRLEKIGTDEALALRGRAAVANARVAYGAFEGMLASERWQQLAEAGARPQRPLWASTGVKNPDYPDTLYVSDLVVADTVNTMPEKTLEAMADHGELQGDQVSGRAREAQEVLDAIVAAGVDWAEVLEVLESEGVSKFEASWDELVETVRGQMEKARA